MVGATMLPRVCEKPGQRLSLAITLRRHLRLVGGRTFDDLFNSEFLGTLKPEPAKQVIDDRVDAKRTNHGLLKYLIDERTVASV